MLRRVFLGLIFLSVACVFLVSPVGAERVYPEVNLTLDTDGTPYIYYSLPPGVADATLLRSTSDLNQFTDPVAYPIASFELSADEILMKDIKAPQGVELFYQIEVKTKSGAVVRSAVESTWLPEPTVGTLSRPHIMVDKLAYALYLMDGDQVVRRFPVALGANPTKRKLHFDRASTPEGTYKITNLQPQAYWYKAFDINYPNDTDKSRYHMADKLGTLPYSRPHIGGEIQIHGGGIDENWTWGCIALRDFDMDYLFSRRELTRGVQISIAGSELRFEDLQVIASTTPGEKAQYLTKLRELGFADNASFGAALGRFQYNSSLPVTTQLDRRTRAMLDRYIKLGAR